MTLLIIIWIAGVIPAAAILAWIEYGGDNTPMALLLSWLWPFVLVQAIGWVIGCWLATWRKI